MIPQTKRGSKRQTTQEFRMQEPYEISNILQDAMAKALEETKLSFDKTTSDLPLYPLDHVLDRSSSNMLRLAVMGKTLYLHSVPIFRALVAMHKQNLLIRAAQAVNEFSLLHPDQKCRVVVHLGPADSTQYANTKGELIYGWVIEDGDDLLRVETESSFQVEVIAAE